MFDKLIRWSIESRVLIIIAAIALTATGIFTAMTMPVDVFPDLTAPIVTVMTEANGMAPTEVENLVTFPVEAALNGAAGVRRVRSSSAVGLSIVWVEFQWGTDIYRARQIVTEKLALINEQLPEEVEKPVLTPVSSIMGEIQYIGLTTDRHSPIELRTTADNVVRRRLLSVPGVSQVINIGGDVKQYHVVINQERLWSYKISLDDVRTALQHSNKNDSAGFMVKNGTEYIVKGLGRIQSLEDIGNTVVAEVNNIPIRVSDIATVTIGAEPKRGEGSANGQPAVIIGVQKGPDINTMALSAEIDKVLAEIEKKLPQGMELNGRIFRQADFIEVSIANIEHALRDGTILVILVMLVFLANLRATFITLTAVPLSLMTSVLILNAMGATINSMTLGGMAIAIGALVDDAVIDVENVFRRLRQNQKLTELERRPALEVVYKASVEIRKSIVFATFIIVLVFAPIFFLTEMEGKLLNPLGLAYVTSLLASLLVAVTVTPALCYILLPRSKSLARGTELKPVTWLKKQYARLLDFCLNHPWLVISPGIIQLVLALAAISFMGFSFLPKFNEGALTIGAVSIPGTSLEEASKQGQMAEEIILTVPEVRQVARRTGRAELDEHAMGVDSSEIEVSYVLDQGRSKAEFVKDIRERLSIIPGVGFSVGQPISHRIDHMLSGTRANIAVKIFGDDLYKLRSLGKKALAAMQGIPGIADLNLEKQQDIPLLSVKLNREAMARHGIHVEEATDALHATLQGLKVSEILEGRFSYDLMLLMKTNTEWNPDNFEDVLIDTPEGTMVPLSEIALVQKDYGPNRVSREQLERKIVISCNTADRDVGSLVADIRKAVDPLFVNQEGYRVEYGGQFENAAKASMLLGFLSILVFTGIGLLLYLAFRSVRDGLLVMINLPLALIGGVVGVFVSGGVLSVASIIGFITVFGIATRNGIMLVSHIRHLQKHEGVTDFREAVFRGAIERLVPILMTALATALALIPLALGGDQAGSEIQTPMAIVILFGLSTSMILNMLVVPALYLKFGRPLNPVEVEK